MADFRRWFIALAVLALMAGAASAQVGYPTGSTGNALLCSATGAGIPELRPEGYTELVGDIVISCTGGPNLQPGSEIPTTNIVVYMSPAVPITSRFMSSNGASDALLIIDEAGGNVNTAANPAGTSGTGYGPQAPQVLCSYSQQQTVSNGGTVVGCPAYVGTASTFGYGPIAVAVAGTTGQAALTNAANVYQGKVGDFGTNSVTFYNVPVLPPSTGGVSRVFRITNIRVPVPGGNLSGSLQAIISTSPSAALPVSGTAINIGIVGNPMTAAVKQVSTPFTQCVGQGPSSITVALAANLIYTEGFATGFKTRVVPGGNANNTLAANPNFLWAGQETNTASQPFNQNIPGSQYGQFSANSESGFIFPGLVTNNTGSAAVNYVAGLADFGTRLKAVFYNLPSGVSLYVSQVSSGTGTNAVPAPIGGTSVLPYAVLVASNTGEGTQDAFSTNGSFTSEIAQSTNSKNTGIVGTDGLAAVQLSANSSGAYEAVWEVTNSNPNKQDVLTFSVYVAYTPVAASGTNVYGLPIAPVFPPGLPGLIPNDVQLSFAPEPSSGIFTAATGPVGSTNPIPRFAVLKTQEGPYLTITLCQTTLLYPYVVGANGFDTGIAVANTSWDPFNTVPQSGSCSLYAYGVTVGTSGNTSLGKPPTGGNVPGCDLIANPTATNCFPVVPYGQVMSVQASSVLPNFYGYVIAICNFQYAHGYASVSDLGLRNLWTAYLALELAPQQTLSCTSSGCTGSITIGSPRPPSSLGPSGIESLMH